MSYGTWKEQLVFDGITYRADAVAAAQAERAGVDGIYAIYGLPPQFEDALVVSAQVCDVPHTWRVKECATPAEVTEEIIRRGREALRRDQAELNAHIVTYVGVRGDRTFEFLAAGAVRDKLTRDYQNEQYPVVSRAIVAPEHRGKGLGTLIVEHRMKAAQRMFSKGPKAIHFGTESAKILRSIKKVEEEEGLKFVYIGDEVYQAADGPHVVHDYLCFMPWFAAELLDCCRTLAASSREPERVESFSAGLSSFMQSGIEEISGKELEHRFLLAKEGLLQNADVERALKEIEEVFFVKQKIGASDPVAH